MRRTFSWSEPPTSGRWSREEFDKWCHEMRERRGYSAWAIAQRLGVSESRVLSAIDRVRAGRYDG